MESFASVQLITIEEDGDGQRIDNYLFKVLKGVPKSHVYRIVRSGEIRVNKGRVKINTRLALGDVLRLPPIRVEERSVVSLGKAAAEQILESVVYEDEGMMVINKPAGMAVHGGSGVSAGVIETLRCALPKVKFLELVHRLDRQTSGCLMIAKKPSVLKALHEDLRGDGVDKRYYALVCGSWPRGQKLINAPLYKQSGGGGDRIVRVDVEGKASRTEFSVLKVYKDYTFVEAKPLTGRTHQIRVHAQFVGCPLVGDDRYGDFLVNRGVAKTYGLKRLFLHAHQLSFFSPIEGKRITVSAPMSDDLERMLARL